MMEKAYGIKYNDFGEAYLFIMTGGQTMQIELNKTDLKKLIRLLEAVQMDKLLNGGK